MSKVSFRARALDASKPMPIYMAEELPDLPDYSAINRVVPQMPSGMQKEEECEHHLQRAICAGLIIPTPEVTGLADVELYEKIYPADYKLPRQLIHMQPFAMEQDIPDYDMDSEDEIWILSQRRKMDLSILQFEEMMDRLEKSSGQSVVTLNEAKSLLKEDDDLIIAVFDYWLNKRLKTQHPLLLNVKTEHRVGMAANNPYLAFRRRTEKMITRKNRKNDETSYEKMLKLRRDLSRAVTLLELVKKREKTKREYLHLTVEVYEKRYQAQDFSGQLFNEISAVKSSRLAFAPLFSNQYGIHQNWSNKMYPKDDIPRREKRQYKKRKFKSDRNCLEEGTGNACRRIRMIGGIPSICSSDDEASPPLCLQGSDHKIDKVAEEGKFIFKRNKNNCYLPPVSGNWPWCNKNEGGLADPKYKFVLTSINQPKPKCIGLARRRMGRGGRVILDRYSYDEGDLWSSLDFTVQTSNTDLVKTKSILALNHVIPKDWPHFSPEINHLDEESNSNEVCNNLPSENNLKSKYFSEAFCPSTSSIYVDFENDNYDPNTLTSEFNLIDYFSTNSQVINSNLKNQSKSIQTEKLTDNIDWQTDIGCSNISVWSDAGSNLPKIAVGPDGNSDNTQSCNESQSKKATTNTLKCSNASPNLNQANLNLTTEERVQTWNNFDNSKKKCLINLGNSLKTFDNTKQNSSLMQLSSFKNVLQPYNNDQTDITSEASTDVQIKNKMSIHLDANKLKNIGESHEEQT